MENKMISCQEMKPKGKRSGNFSGFKIKTIYNITKSEKRYICLFDLILYVPSTIFQLYRD